MSVDGQHGTRGPGIGAIAFVPMAITVAATVGLLWATGNISALLTRGRRPRAALEDMGAVAVRLAQHPEEPAAAWPAADHQVIPGPAPFYATLVVLLGLAAVLGLFSWHSYLRFQAVLPAGGGSTASG